ncbi:MAG: DUF2490 domain-containing protein [Pontixanthobacter sp.]
MFNRSIPFLLVGLLTMPTTAIASDDAAELWLNPSVSFDLDDDTGMEIETAQRFRDADDGRVDTFFARLWLNQEINDALTLSGAIERRINDGGPDETRFIQQMSTRHGIVRTRLRLEQRLVDDADRMGFRLRPRLGAAVPIDQDGRWSFKTDAELFLTLRGNNSGSDTGLTGLRTQVGFGYDVNDRLSVSAVYLRQQDFEDDGPDQVGHAPLIGVEFAF